MLRRFKVFAFCVVLVASVATLFALDRELNRPLVFEPDQLSAEGAFLLKVPKGQTLSALVGDLKRREVLRYDLPFRLFVKLTGRGNIRAGEYHLSRDDTPLSLLDKLESGEVVQYRITFPEGLTLREWLALMAGDEGIETEVTGLDLSQIAQRLGIEQANPEGWFAADTYNYSAGDSDLDILQKAHRAMEILLTDLWQQRAENLPYASPYEALIMASIVERETGVAAERAQIAGVFVRRLRKPMRLQTDPTVIYGLGERYQGNITRRHLREPTPYNTYTIDGLPPTPIANPGADALEAALHPADGSSLYFVAKGDGSHQFSATLAEHQAAVRRYQLAGRKRTGYRSAPAQNQSTSDDESQL
ncbi:MAG: endolytic transglycosylase MltG [Porticoccaceae bacterium]|nr:endolytic transglycosylase MltG [Porticoccaceae bacterium]